MTITNRFCRPIKPLLKVGFSIAAIGTTKNYYNLAVSYNKMNAIKGDYPNLELDYSAVMISEGSLMPAENPTVERVPEGLKFSWDPEIAQSHNSDQVMLLVCAPGTMKVRMTRYGAKRSVGFEILPIQGAMIDEPLETYISFINEDRTEVANSTYLGRVNG